MGANDTSVVLLFKKVITVMSAVGGEAECREDTERTGMCPCWGESTSGWAHEKNFSGGVMLKPIE